MSDGNMRAEEKVVLMGAKNDDLMFQFASAVKGEYSTLWEGFSTEQKVAFIQKFSDAIENHAIRAFEIGVRYGRSKNP